MADLQSALTRADGSVMVLSARTLRKVIERDRGLRWLSGRARRHVTYVIDKERLDLLADDLGIETCQRGESSEPRILIAAPERNDRAWSKPETLLLLGWRRVYRGKIEEAVANGQTSARVAERIQRIGRVEFEEIRNVLNADRLLFDPDDDIEVYQRFAGWYCELLMFAPALIRHAFPGLKPGIKLDELFPENVDAFALLRATRPEGAPDPPTLSAKPTEAEDADYPEDEILDEESEASPEDDRDEPAEPIRGSARLKLLNRAAKALERGNAVRAAILRDASARNADPGSTTIQADLRAAAKALEQLAGRLQAALFFPKGEIGRWAKALAPLLRRASRGFWSPEARLLYDLQKVCIDHEKETYRIELLPWLFSLGKKPLKRPLPHLREVMMSHHLRRASGRLSQVKLSRENRNHLEGLLRPAARLAEKTLRESFRPTIDATLKAHWVVPENLPEQVAYQRLVEELLDGIVDRGYLSLGDLRDAASRSQLKLPDLASPRDFFQGNQLIKTDKALSLALDGVHRRGEIYLRWLQRFSSLAFATPVGRFLSLYLALPFGGAFVVLEGLQHLLGLVVEYFTGSHLELMNRWSLLTLGTVALLAINFLRFRQEFLVVMRVGLRSIRAILYDWPARLLNTPWLRAILRSRIVVKLWSLALRPALFAIPVPVVAGRVFGDLRVALLSWGIATFTLSLMINTKLGRKVEEWILESLGGLWQWLIQDFLPGLFHLIMNAFQNALERLERLLYAVDEWLRFRDGQSQASLIGKGLIGLVWFAFAYLARIYVNLLIEPQVNPIKHFPVVTVSHKVILPMTVHLVRIVSAPLKPILGTVAANTVATMQVLLLPGVFGFLVWELKANWRLYKANRSRTLDPVLVGSHGESMTRLLRPGFHSGTLPKAFRKLRQAEAKPTSGTREKAGLKPLNTLHHAEDAIRHFLERDFIAYLTSCDETFANVIHVGSIHLSTNRIHVELVLENEDRKSLWIDLQDFKGVLEGGMVEEGWLPSLAEFERKILHDLLPGLYTMCGVQRSLSSETAELAPIEWDAWVKTWTANQRGTEEEY